MLSYIVSTVYKESVLDSNLNMIDFTMDHGQKMETYISNKENNTVSITNDVIEILPPKVAEK